MTSTLAGTQPLHEWPLSPCQAGYSLPAEGGVDAVRQLLTEGARPPLPSRHAADTLVAHGAGPWPPADCAAPPATACRASTSASTTAPASESGRLPAIQGGDITSVDDIPAAMEARSIHKGSFSPLRRRQFQINVSRRLAEQVA